jgi:tetratricopeptide (TPR) repeat protein
MPQSAVQQLLSKATAFYHAGDYQQAVQAWKEILDLDPSNQRAKEGIRMASLLLEEAQLTAEAKPSGTEGGGVESPEVAAKVRAGIEQVRAFLAGSRHLEAIEACRTLLALAPRSAAVREIVEEAREAYEAQPFIHEHLEIARQLFIQERLDEALGECQKVFFLNPNHAEAQKLQGKIKALKQKQSAQAVPETPAGLETLPPAPPLGPDSRLSPPADAAPDQGDPSATSRKPGAADTEPALNENWEAELAQAGLGSSPETETAGKPESPASSEDAVPLVDLSEDPRVSGPGGATAPATPTAGSGVDIDLEPLPEDLEAEAEGSGLKSLRRESARVREIEDPSLTRHATLRGTPGRTASGRRWLLPVLGVLIGGGFLAWYFGLRPASPGGVAPPQPPSASVPPRAVAGAANGVRGRANLGLSSTGTRAGGTAAQVGPAGAGADPQEKTPTPGDAGPVAPVLTPEEARKEVARLSREGKRLMQQGDYRGAAVAFSQVLDLDAANLEIKEQLDQVTARILEQKRLEEDVQTGKELFLEKDYESALRKFYRLPRDRNLGNLDLFIRNAWYNWGVISLKAGNCPDALQRLQEALSMDPGDSEALKQEEVADHYKDRPKDRAYYAYVDRLSLRTLDQK